MHLLRVAARRGDLLLECGVVRLRLFERVVVDEYQLGPARGEATAAAALARLDEHRMALRRTRHGERSARAEVFADMIQPPHLVGMREQAGLLVEHDRVVVPGIPVADYDFQEFVGAVVALVVFAMRCMAHVAVLRRRSSR